MKAIMVMFDSLNHHMLEPYGCDWIHTPNFQRLAEKAVTFDNSYVGSMPCMPARRELHNGRYNFLHRSWSPLEPFDDSLPEILKNNSVFTHIVSDHYHYWEDGGATYHTRYNSWEIARGQEGNPWKGEVKDPEIPEYLGGRKNVLWRQYWINRKYMSTEETHSQTVTFNLGLDFINTNKDQDNWFLQIEAFDPHEPFFTQEKYKKMYPHDYKRPHFDWPNYKSVDETPEQIEHVRNEYAALVSMCDENLGKILDAMDKYSLWDNTMLIVNTDHGFLLGEHDWWAKCVQPFFNEIAHTPLFIWDPRCGIKGERRQSLVQTMDLAPTLLEYFGVAIPKDMQGKSLRETLVSDAPIREAALYGIHGGHVNCTDGRYVYMRAPVSEDNQPLYNYTLMPTHMRNRFSIKELQNTELSDLMSFTKGCKVLKIKSFGIPELNFNPYNFGTLLFDVKNDPLQKEPINDPEIESKMVSHLIKLMKENDAPVEQYERLGLSVD
ncbi:MAG: sulfatase [Firmicutes bacterium]|nr:sulfatase [Bacillota bacterium]